MCQEASPICTSLSQIRFQSQLRVLHGDEIRMILLCKKKKFTCCFALFHIRAVATIAILHPFLLPTKKLPPKISAQCFIPRGFSPGPWEMDFPLSAVNQTAKELLVAKFLKVAHIFLPSLKRQIFKVSFAHVFWDFLRQHSRRTTRSILCDAGTTQL